MNVLDVILEIVRVLLVIIYGYISALVSVLVPPSRKSIRGEIVLITGAGHGIGREFALEIAKLGAVVVLWDINKENNEKTLADVKKNGGKGFAYLCDITKPSQIKEVADRVRSDVGEVTILVNNAGVANGGQLLEISEADIRRTFEVNTLAHFWTIKEFLPVMIKKGQGHILNVISMAGIIGLSTLTDYWKVVTGAFLPHQAASPMGRFHQEICHQGGCVQCMCRRVLDPNSASKHAAKGFHEALIEELYTNGHHNIRLTALCPSIVDTGLLKNFDVGKHERLLTPNETALAGIDGMLRNYELVTVPSKMYYATKIGNFFPRKVGQYLLRDSGVNIRTQYKKDN